jgi:hypothetical protein
MAISRAFIRGRAVAMFKSLLSAAVICLAALAPLTRAAAAHPPKSYTAPCEKSEEFSFAQRARAQAKSDIAIGHYSDASKTLEGAINKLDQYMTDRTFSAGLTVLDDTSQHLSLTYFYEIHGNLKKSVYLKMKYLDDTLTSCRTEPKEIGEKLRKLSGH